MFLKLREVLKIKIISSYYQKEIFRNLEINQIKIIQEYLIVQKEYKACLYSSLNKKK